MSVSAKENDLQNRFTVKRLCVCKRKRFEKSFYSKTALQAV